MVPGDEVIVPPYTFIATATAVVTVGAVPVFADIDPETLCLDPDDAARKISPRTRAIIPVHVAGRIADMLRINELAKTHNLAVLEDAAHAWGSQFDGLGAGTIGRCGTFSFQVSKNITAGEGGILVTDDKDLADLCRSFSHCGRTEGSAWYDHNNLGSNLRMTEFQAAILLAQLARLEEHVARRQRNAALLDEALADIPAIHQLAPAPRMTRRSYHMYIFRLNQTELGISRARFIEALRSRGCAGIGRMVPTAVSQWRFRQRPCGAAAWNPGALGRHGSRLPGRFLPSVRTGLRRRRLDPAQCVARRRTANPPSGRGNSQGSGGRDGTS